MRNKIVVVEKDAAQREQLEMILQEVVEEGGELIFAQKTEEVQEIIQKQYPAIVLLDSTFAEMAQIWNYKETHLILTYPLGSAPAPNKDYLFKPFQPHQVLEKCKVYLNREYAPPIPPM